MNINITNGAEILSAIVCTVCFLTMKTFTNSRFIIFLWLTVAIEITGMLTTQHTPFKIPMYNIFNGIEFMFYFVFLREFSANSLTKKVALYISIIFLTFFLINIVGLQKFVTYNSNTHTIGCLLIIILALNLFMNFILSESVEKSVNENVSFIVAAGLFIYYSSSLFNTGIFNYLTISNREQAVVLYKYISSVLNVILYSFFSAAFSYEIIKLKPGKQSIPN